MVNEATVKICKTQKSVKLSDALRIGPLSNSIQFSGVHPESCRGDNKPQEGDGLLIENTFLSRRKEPVIL